MAKMQLPEEAEMPNWHIGVDYCVTRRILSYLVFKVDIWSVIVIDLSQITVAIWREQNELYVRVEQNTNIPS